MNEGLENIEITGKPWHLVKLILSKKNWGVLYALTHLYNTVTSSSLMSCSVV